MPYEQLTVMTSAAITRPANATAYAAEDAVADSDSAPTVLTFSNAVRSSKGGGTIIKAILLTDQAANVARFRLHLYASSVTAINDNAAFTGPLWADRVAYSGAIDFSALTAEGTGATAAYSVNTDVRLPFTAATDKDIYGLLETLDAFTPASAQNFYIKMTVLQD